MKASSKGGLVFVSSRAEKSVYKKGNDMENFESKSTGQNIGAEAERLGKRVSEKISEAANTAGKKIDAAVDYVGDTTRNVREGINQMRDEGWEGMRRRTLDYTREQPLYALLIAIGAGMMLGWLTKRGR